MQYKNQRDIDWIKFAEFSERIDGLNPDQINAEVGRTFFPKQKFSIELVLEFMKAMETPAPFQYRLDLTFNKADRFIDADTYLTENRKLELAQMLVKPKHRLQKIKWDLSTVNHACNAFIEYADPVKEAHEWIYNPPIIMNSKGGTVNAIQQEYMREFVGHYGAYMEIVYLLTNGDLTKADEVTEWNVEKFLFLGEYLLRKKRIESIS